jgi:peptidyl-prolyl cis-trans isomerase A (cyclophilin A)
MAAPSRDFGRPGHFFDARRARGRCCALAVAVIALLGARSGLAGTLVQMNYANFGSVQIDLFDDLTPATVNNFLTGYVATGRYTDTMIHRVDTGFGIIQGGGYTTSVAKVDTTADPTISLQYSRANTRGTIAMARTPAPNSATSQWFINTDDNTTTFGQSNGGGFAVFGWVVGPGMSVIDSIAAVPTFAYGDRNSSFQQLPLQNFTQADYNNHVDPLSHLVVLNSVTVVKTHPSFQNPFLATDVNNDGSLKASDVAAVNLDLLKNGFHNLTGPFSGTSYLDVDGDGKVSPSDSLKAINAVLKAPQVSPLMEPSASPMLVVPEPGSLTLGGLVALALAAYAARVRRQRRNEVRN